MEEEYDELQMTFKEEEIKHLKELYMAKVSQISPEDLATMNSDGSNDASSRTNTQEPVAPSRTSKSASSHRNTILFVLIDRGGGLRLLNDTNLGCHILK